jgi:hypothetical protein
MSFFVSSEGLIKTYANVQGGGESMNQMNERCVSYLNKIAQQHIGNQQMSSSPCLASNRLNNKKNLHYISRLPLNIC